MKSSKIFLSSGNKDRIEGAMMVVPLLKKEVYGFSDSIFLALCP